MPETQKRPADEPREAVSKRGANAVRECPMCVEAGIGRPGETSAKSADGLNRQVLRGGWRAFAVFLRQFCADMRENYARRRRIRWRLAWSRPGLSPAGPRRGGSGAQDHLHRLFAGGVAEHLIGLHHLVEREAVGDQLRRIDAGVAERLQQHRRGVGVHQPHRDVDVLDPELFDMQLDRLAVHADVGDVAAGRDDLLAGVEGRRHADRLDRHVDALAMGHLHDPGHHVLGADLDRVGGAELPCELEPCRVHVDHDDPAGREELRGQQHRHPHRAGADHGDGVAGLHMAVLHADLEAGRQDVRQHHQRLFVGPRRDRVQRMVGMRDAHVFGLGTVDRVAENPAAVGAMGIEAALAVRAFAAGGDAGDQHRVAGLEVHHRVADLLDDADALVAKRAARRHGGHVAFQDVQVGAADRGLADLHDHVGRFLDRRFVFLDPVLLAGALEHQCFHLEASSLDFSMRLHAEA
ncbi:hypothetical protein SDC9_26369 [bioreactor metagenome]|uniref:Uncharacterized protein n=1 Tax=bioreactor metagenome TaxID=1076179 RepID=A0A644UNG6_9ZZZZ